MLHPRAQLGDEESRKAADKLRLDLSMEKDGKKFRLQIDKPPRDGIVSRRFSAPRKRNLFFNAK